MKKFIPTSFCLICFGGGEYSPKYDLTPSFVTFLTTSNPSLLISNVARNFLLVILETSISSIRASTWGCGFASTTFRNPCKLLRTSQLHKSSDTRIGMLCSSINRSSLYGGGEKRCMLWRRRTENFWARIRFSFCGELVVTEICFREISLCMMPREYKRYY